MSEPARAEGPFLQSQPELKLSPRRSRRVSDSDIDRIKIRFKQKQNQFQTFLVADTPDRRRCPFGGCIEVANGAKRGSYWEAMLLDARDGKFGGLMKPRRVPDGGWIGIEIAAKLGSDAEAVQRPRWRLDWN